MLLFEVSIIKIVLFCEECLRGQQCYTYPPGVWILRAAGWLGSDYFKYRCSDGLTRMYFIRLTEQSQGLNQRFWLGTSKSSHGVLPMAAFFLLLTGFFSFNGSALSPSAH
ncbi:hypothetical protein [Phyllobacterium sp. K27]